MTMKTKKPLLPPPLAKPISTVAPADSWPYKQLWLRVRSALSSLPVYFRSDTFIEGINATDIFTLNTALGATIENQVVETLNQIRSVWDPSDQYQTLAFVRQPQTFPDVILKDLSDETRPPILGIELKGWYLLAKEGEPSLRFTQTPAACTDADMIMVVPWVLGNVISGRPKIYASYVESARFVAEYRNEHWQHKRDAKSSSDIRLPSGVIAPYPGKSVSSTDTPVSDKGGNFGRIARTGIMDDYMARIKHTPLCGIRALYWLEFFKVFHQDATDKSILEALEKLKKRISDDAPPRAATPSREDALNILYALERLLFQ